MRVLIPFLALFSVLFADGTNQQNSPLWGQARLLNIDTYTEGLACKKRRDRFLFPKGRLDNPIAEPL